MTGQRCRGRTAEGKPCESPFVGADGFCVAHRAGGSEKMRERARKGGEATKRRHAGDGLPASVLGPLESIQDAQRWLRLIAQAVGCRDLTHSEGQAMTRAVQEWVRAEAERVKTEEVVELQRQVAELKRRGVKAV